MAGQLQLKSEIRQCQMSTQEIMPKMKTFERDWNTSLWKQMTKDELPDFKNTWRKSSGHFKELLRLLEN